MLVFHFVRKPQKNNFLRKNVQVFSIFKLFRQALRQGTEDNTLRMKFFFQTSARKPGFERILGLPIAYEVSAGAILFRKSSGGAFEFLLLQYRHRHWDFAKGHIEAGETREEAARRETEEETGISDIRIVPGFHRRTHFFYIAKGTEIDRRRREGRAPWIFKTVHFFLAEAPGDISLRLSDEHLDAVWLPFDEALERATFENAKRLLRAAQAFLEKKVVRCT